MSTSKLVKPIPKADSKGPPDQRRGPFKFIPRCLRISNTNYKAFETIRVKGLYLRKLIDDRGFDYYEIETEEEIAYKTFKNKKLFKTLKYLKVPSAYRTYLHDSFKYAKNLKSVAIKSDLASRLSQIAFSIRRLPRKVEMLRLCIRESEVTKSDIYEVAQSIRILPQLKYFYHKYDLEETDEKQVPRELRIYDQSVSRLKNVKQIIYNVHNNERAGLQRAMIRGSVYPGITGLKLKLLNPRYGDAYREPVIEEEKQIDYEHMTKAQKRACREIQRQFRIDTARIEDDPEYSKLAKPHNYQEEIESEPSEPQAPFVPNEDFVANCIAREKTRLFYRFELFPNLKKLHISQSNQVYPFGSFIVECFAALKQLEQFKLNIHHRPRGESYIFQGLLKLPLLKKFSLKLPFITNQEWVLLDKFLRKQTNLESFRISIIQAPSSKARYLLQNIYLKNIIACLENNKSLKSLELQLSFRSLEAVSQGLARLGMTNQLQSLKFEGIDDNITSQTKSEARVEGLCNFIKNQKESLKLVKISLPLVLEESIVAHIGEAISELKQLRSLSLSFNNLFSANKESIDYIQNLLQSGIPGESKMKLRESTEWNPNLEKYLLRLENLEDLEINFEVFNKESTRWFVDVFRALPDIGRIKNLKTSTRSFNWFEDMEEKFISAVLELKNVWSVDMKFYKGCGGGLCQVMMMNLESKLYDVNENQGMKCSLMF